MQALVTGGSGFIGSEVINQLTNQGVRVRALLRKTSSRANLQGLEFEAALGDLSEFEALKAAVRGVDYVFHLAGTVNARNREEFFLHNAVGTGNLARACAEVNPGLKRFVYVSSMAASGPSPTSSPMAEGEPEAPVSAYGESKLAGEKELLRWSDAFPTTVVRPPAVYGPRDKAIFEFVKMVNSGIVIDPPSKSGSREKLFSVIYVEDLVRGIVLAGLSAGQAKREVFFLCGDGIHTWTQMMGAMADKLGKKPVRIPLPSFAWTGLAGVFSAAGWLLQKQFTLNLDKLKELESEHWICSNERAKKVLGFEPRWDISRGMAQTISWYKDNGWV